MAFNLCSLQKWLSSRTTLGVRLWVLIVTFIPLFLLLILTITFTCHVCFRRRRRKRNRRSDDREAAMPGEVFPEMEMSIKKGSEDQLSRQTSVTTQTSIVTDWEYSAGRYSPAADKDGRRRSVFGLEEVELATNGFSEENVIGTEDYGVDYFGNLVDDTKVTVKVLNANDRMLVYENVDNGNLHQWLHGHPQKHFSPLTWSIRMDIIQGIAKGLAYLHEDVEPRILHGRLRSSCILLDQNWNPQIANFGFVKVFPPEYWTAPLVGESCESLEHGSTSPITEKNDVYSFGILLMEIVTGRTPVDCNQSQPYLIEWVKSMIRSQQAAETLDPRLEEKPSSKQLKRLLLIALRCVDPEMQHRPSMGHILHMLEPRDLLLTDGNQIGRVSSCQCSSID